MTQEQSFFKKISDPLERDQLFQDLCKVPCEILGKEHKASSEVILLKAEIYTSPELSLKPLDPDFQFQATGEIVLQMTIGNEKYLYSSVYKFRGGIITVKATEPLFRLQRREDFRLKIPSGVTAIFQLESNNRSHLAKKMKVIDLSAGGCRLSESNPNPTLSLGDEIVGTLQIAERPAFQINGKIVHSVIEDGQKSQSVGVFFTHLTPPAKNKIAGLVMDLYRQLFSKLN